MYTDNDPLPYIKESMLWLAQIQWLSKLAPFDFDIKYRTGKSIQGADALCHCFKSISDDSSDNDCHEYDISYAMVCDDITSIIKDKKPPFDIESNSL